MVWQDTKDGSDETAAPENSTQASESHRLVIRVGNSLTQLENEPVAECGTSQVTERYLILKMLQY